MDVNIEITELNLDEIPTFLKENKQILIDTDLKLDRYEISKSLTISLNRMLMGSKIKLADVYDSIINNFEDTTKKIKLIEEKIKNFNSEEKFIYFVDPEKILYIIFFKQIVYIKKLIDDLHNYVSSNINIVFIYSYIISKLYNNPENITNNYVFILNKMIYDTKFLSKYDDTIKKLLSPEIIEKIFFIIKLIFSADIDFNKLLMDLEKEKMEEYKKNNSVDHSETYNELSKINKQVVKNVKGGNTNIYDIENNYQQKIDFLFLQKRKIDINILCDVDNLNMILQDGITIELWYGYNLFIYKRFDYDFNEYQNKINEILNSKGYDKIYLLSLNYLNDINAPDAGIIPIIGGNININENNNYYSKYIKYKNKYLELKNLKNKYN
jgi:hypothetical protein